MVNIINPTWLERCCCAAPHVCLIGRRFLRHQTRQRSLRRLNDLHLCGNPPAPEPAMLNWEDIKKKKVQHAGQEGTVEPDRKETRKWTLGLTGHTCCASLSPLWSRLKAVIMWGRKSAWHDLQTLNHQPESKHPPQSRIFLLELTWLALLSLWAYMLPYSKKDLFFFPKCSKMWVRDAGMDRWTYNKYLNRL